MSIPEARPQLRDALSAALAAAIVATTTGARSGVTSGDLTASARNVLRDSDARPREIEQLRALIDTIEERDVSRERVRRGAAQTYRNLARGKQR